MMHFFLRRHAWFVPVALSLWSVGSVPAIGAESAAPPVVSADPAAPDAPTDPIPRSSAGVLDDFAPPALSIATGDWRKVNADVTGTSGMSGMTPSPSGHEAMGHAMPMPPASEATRSTPTSPASGTPPNPHAGHVMQGGLK